MSQENLEPVRIPIAMTVKDSQRRLEERLSLRFPGLAAVGGRVLQRLSPRSRLRQSAIRRLVQVFLGAYNRKDLEACYSPYTPDSESIYPHQLVEVGFLPVVRGREAIVSVQRRWRADWGEFRIEPDAAIDLRERLLLLGRITGSGLSSGAGVDTDWGLLVTIAAGRITREQVYLDRKEALEAVGLSE